MGHVVGWVVTVIGPIPAVLGRKPGPVLGALGLLALDAQGAAAWVHLHCCAARVERDCDAASGNTGTLPCPCLCCHVCCHDRRCCAGRHLWRALLCRRRGGLFPRPAASALVPHTVRSRGSRAVVVLVPDRCVRACRRWFKGWEAGQLRGLLLLCAAHNRTEFCSDLEESRQQKCVGITFELVFYRRLARYSLLSSNQRKALFSTQFSAFLCTLPPGHARLSANTHTLAPSLSAPRERC